MKLESTYLAVCVIAGLRRPSDGASRRHADAEVRRQALPRRGSSRGTPSSTTVRSLPCPLPQARSSRASSSNPSRRAYASSSRASAPPRTSHPSVRARFSMFHTVLAVQTAAALLLRVIGPRFLPSRSRSFSHVHTQRRAPRACSPPGCGTSSHSPRTARSRRSSCASRGRTSSTPRPGLRYPHRPTDCTGGQSISPPSTSSARSLCTASAQDAALGYANIGNLAHRAHRVLHTLRCAFLPHRAAPPPRMRLRTVFPPGAFMLARADASALVVLSARRGRGRGALLYVRVLLRVGVGGVVWLVRPARDPEGRKGRAMIHSLYDVTENKVVYNKG
ncbi:hypothetical protein HYPSUDRAFT_647563 [Hypholoma sublateritium FD-334 SS-4]|uniref:Uncharacterized protein n=1 Tax=Hypholoma sublateritium (strain FD-334 SS-4) TaxID=945553 RepID=A0A0D2MGH1_HYPSF|nr:hypothetical protein HYPSUDRAFT_647563 [Hypholoma sublateritium FD-334 SS-4]